MGQEAHTAPDRVRLVATWVGRSQEGDPDAFANLVREFTEPLTRFARVMLGGWQEAEDAVQEAWIRIWRRLPQLQERAAFVGWTYSVTRHVCLDRIRASDRRPASSLDELTSSVGLDVSAPSEAEPETAAVLADDVAQAWALLERLPLAQREAFVLVAVEGLSYEEAARAMGTAASTVRGRLARARASLAEVRSVGTSSFAADVAKEVRS